MAAQASGEQEAMDDTAPRSSKFRFKSKKHRRGDEDDHGRDSEDGSERTERHRKRRRRSNDDSSSHNHRHHRHRRRHRYDRHDKPSVDDPSAYDDTYSANTRSAGYLDPDAAFRESLFDALADDEGAAYWESVYGQPIHTYSRDGDRGELERMSDDEYAQYVRGKMWERTHQHVVEERRKRAEEAEQKRREQRRREKEWRKFREEERGRESTRRRPRSERALSEDEAERRARRERRSKAWAEYQSRWGALRENVPGVDEKNESIERIIPWPVSSGRFRHVTPEAIEEFLKDVLPSRGRSEEAAAVLKIERVRWHPDKVQQRFGHLGIDERVMKAVTSVFQVVDRMWNDVR